MKYILFETNAGFDVRIFPSHKIHAEVALEVGGTPVSAGTISIVNNKVCCFGDAKSLKLKSEPGDTEIVQAAFESR